MRERYEAEMLELENCERTARTRYLEAKTILAQKEEEIVYMRARLHTQNLELNELQQVCKMSQRVLYIIFCKNTMTHLVTVR